MLELLAFNKKTQTKQTIEETTSSNPIYTHHNEQISEDNQEKIEIKESTRDQKQINNENYLKQIFNNMSTPNKIAIAYEAELKKKHFFNIL